MRRARLKPFTFKRKGFLPFNLYLKIFDWLIDIKVDNLHLTETLAQIYYPFLTSQRISNKKLCYQVRARNLSLGKIQIVQAGAPLTTSWNLSDFFYLLEKSITIELQKKRDDLYFVHSAVLSHREKTVMVVAPSGTGKSTTTWGLLNEGFEFISDELAPIKISTLQVYPYPRALCLKAKPPIYKLPRSALTIGRNFYLPATILPSQCKTQPLSLHAIFFLLYSPESTTTKTERLSAAESASLIFSNTLNALAHPGMGLDGAITIGRSCFSYRLTSNRNLEEIIQAIKWEVEETI